VVIKYDELTSEEREKRFLDFKSTREKKREAAEKERTALEEKLEQYDWKVEFSQLPIEKQLVAFYIAADLDDDDFPGENELSDNYLDDWKLYHAIERAKIAK